MAEAKVVKITGITLTLDVNETLAFMDLFNGIGYGDVERFISEEQYRLLDKAWDAGYDVLGSHNVDDYFTT